MAYEGGKPESGKPRKRMMPLWWVADRLRGFLLPAFGF
jgi:hypothetical protein